MDSACNVVVLNYPLGDVKPGAIIDIVDGNVKVRLIKGPEFNSPFKVIDMEMNHLKNMTNTPDPSSHVVVLNYPLADVKPGEQLDIVDGNVKIRLIKGRTITSPYQIINMEMQSSENPNINFSKTNAATNENNVKEETLEGPLEAMPGDGTKSKEITSDQAWNVELNCPLSDVIPAQIDVVDDYKTCLIKSPAVNYPVKVMEMEGKLHENVDMSLNSINDAANVNTVKAATVTVPPDTILIVGTISNEIKSDPAYNVSVLNYPVAEVNPGHEDVYENEKNCLILSPNSPYEVKEATLAVAPDTMPVVGTNSKEIESDLACNVSVLNYPVAEVNPGHQDVYENENHCLIHSPAFNFPYEVMNVEGNSSPNIDIVREETVGISLETTGDDVIAEAVLPLIPSGLIRKELLIQIAQSISDNLTEKELIELHISEKHDKLQNM